MRLQNCESSNSSFQKQWYLYREKADCRWDTRGQLISSSFRETGDDLHFFYLVLIFLSHTWTNDKVLLEPHFKRACFWLGFFPMQLGNCFCSVNFLCGFSYSDFGDNCLYLVFERVRSVNEDYFTEPSFAQLIVWKKFCKAMLACSPTVFLVMKTHALPQGHLSRNLFIQM